MDRTDILPSRLEAIARDLKQLAVRAREPDQGQVAQELNAAIAALQQLTPPEADEGLMTTGEARQMLGIRSVNTIKRWAREGLLEGHRRGGRVLVSRRSVEALRQSPTLAAERASEADLDAALAPFDVGAEPVEPLGWTTQGRKPWAAGAAGAVTPA
jgi:hypothetical protein